MESFIYDFENIDNKSNSKQGLVNFKVKIQEGNHIVGYEFGGVQYATDDNGVLVAYAQTLYELSYNNGTISGEKDVYVMGDYDLNFTFNKLKRAFPLNNFKNKLIHSCLDGVRKVTYPVFE